MCDHSRAAAPEWSRRRLLVAAGATAAGWTLVAGGRAGAASFAPRAVEVAPGLEVLPRDTWAAGRPALADPQPEDVRFLLVHHTASPNAYDRPGALDVMRIAYDFHTGPAKGWPDVAYNFFVDRFGRVFEGRAGSIDGPVMADATGGSQGFAQTVCLLGDFTDESPTDAAVDSLIRVLAWLGGRFQIDTAPGATVTFTSRGSNRWPAGAKVVAATISGHRDMSATACPGDRFYPYVHDQLALDVDALRLQTATATATTTTSTTTSTTPTTTVVASTTTSANTVAQPTSTSPTPTEAPAPPGPGQADAPAAADGADGTTRLVAIAAAIAGASAVGWKLSADSKQRRRNEERRSGD